MDQDITKDRDRKGHLDRWPGDPGSSRPDGWRHGWGGAERHAQCRGRHSRRGQPHSEGRGAPNTTNKSCIPGAEKWRWGFPSCGSRPLRRPPLGGTVAALRRGSLDRDVTGWRIDPPGGGRYRFALVHPNFVEHSFRFWHQEGLQPDRGLAERADHGLPCLFQSWRDCDEEALRWRSAQCLAACGHRRERERLPCASREGHKDDKASWTDFLKHFKRSGLRRVSSSSPCLGLVEADAELYPKARWQRCMVHWYRNALSRVPKGRMSEVARMLKAIHVQENR